MAGSKVWLIGLALASAPGAALAQSVAPKPAPAAPKPAPAAKPKTVEAITVTGAAPDTESSLDKRSFTLGKDIQATTGSIADALRNLPAVEVDLQGNLSLRGDPNVTILVDGKPSPAFEGKGRADALQQLPADQIERVEVITNPSAALNPEGSGGVINLITKQSRGAGATGSAYATAASAGLKRAGVNFGYNTKTLAVTASLAGNYQRNKAHVHDVRDAVDPVTGRTTLNADDRNVGRNITRGPTARVNVTYKPNDKDQITGAASYNEILVYGHPFDRLVETAADGSVAEVLARQGARRFLETDTSLAAGWRHSFAGEGHDLSVDVVHNDSFGRDHTIYTTLEALPPTATPLDRIHDDENNRHSELRVAYSQPLAGGSLKAGYEIRYDDNFFPYDDAKGVTVDALVPVPSLANHFRLKQTVNAVYATYQHAYGDFDVQLGLRGESVRLDLDQQTSGERDAQDYDKVYPSLHLGYKLDDERKLTASYSERVQRPPGVFLNPLRYVQPPNEVQQGNPDLKPTITHSFELGYEARRGQSSYTVTAYYRQTDNDFVQTVIDLGGGIFEDTFGNLGSSRTAGLELTANGKLTSTLSYNASASAYWKHIDAANLGVGVGAREDYSGNGRVNLNWQARPDDMLQFNAVVTGRRLTAQGANLPGYTLNLGWRHKVNDRITATLTAQDLAASSRFERRLNTPTIFERLDVRPVSRQVFFRLDYRFGGRPAKGAKEPGFEYENGGPGPS